MRLIPTPLKHAPGLVLLADSEDLLSLSRCLSACGCRLYLVDSVADAEAVVAANDVDIMVVDYCADYDPFLTWFYENHTSPWFGGSPHVILLTDRREPDSLGQVFGLPFSTHMMSKTNKFLREELVVTVGKIVRKDIFGVDKYLCFGATPITYEVSSSRQKDLLINKMFEYGESFGIQKRILSAAGAVADELLMNAIYDAPVSPDGTRPYASRSRTLPVELGREERCYFTFATDGVRLILSVRDRFGSIDAEKIMSYLRRCYARGADQIEQKAGGAGMGLYMMMGRLNRFIVNIYPDKATEFIGILDCSGTYRQYAELYKSFHVFVAS